MSQKITEELCVMTLKGDAISKEKLTGGLKNDIRNLFGFNESSQNSENLHSDGLLLAIAYKVRAIQTLKKDWLFVRKMTVINLVNLVNFYMSSEKSENLHFHRLFLSKVCNVWAKKIQRSRVVENDLCFQKWHKEFGEFSHK